MQNAAARENSGVFAIKVFAGIKFKKPNIIPAYTKKN